MCPDYEKRRLPGIFGLEPERPDGEQTVKASAIFRRDREMWIDPVGLVRRQVGPGGPIGPG